MDRKNSASLWNAPAFEPERELVERGSGRLACVPPPLSPVELSALSKSAQCYQLAVEGRMELPLVPRAAKEVVIDPDQGIDIAVHDALRECLEQIATNLLVVVKLADTEGPHQLRTGLRRLRCVFSIYAPILKNAESARLAREARWLARAVGSLRDLDVAANKIASETEANPDEPSLRPIAERFARKAEDRRQQLRRRLALPCSRYFLIDLVRLVENRGWTRNRECQGSDGVPATTNEFAGIAISDCWRASCEASRRLDGLDFDRSHEFRKEIRKLRYTVEFLSSLFAESQTRPLLGSLRNLQTLLGSVSDASMIQAMLTKEALTKKHTRLEYAAGWLIGTQNSHARSEWMRAKSVWSRIEGTRPFWSCNVSSLATGDTANSRTLTKEL
jgi:CHAD domain-containing protein